jgi:hypothetical protein
VGRHAHRLSQVLTFTIKCVASASIFVASKSEECGRRLKDVAMVCMSKATAIGSLLLDDDLSVRIMHDRRKALNDPCRDWRNGKNQS